MINLWLQPTPVPFTTKLCWQDSNLDTNGVVYLIYVDSEFLGHTYNPYFFLQNIREDLLYSIDVIRTSDTEASLFDWTSYVSHPSLGSRVKIQMEEIDLKANPDFKSYKIYSSDDNITYTLLAENQGANQTVFITDELEDGMWYFKLSFLDYVGNESAQGSAYSILVKSIPNSVINVVSVYENNKIHITANAPAIQHSDVTGYYIFSNYYRELLEAISFDFDTALYFNTSVIDFTSFTLSPGYWKFSVCAVDSSGLISNYEEITLNLDDNMLEIEDPPTKPVIDAIPVLAGGINITGEGWGYTSDVYLDAVLYEDGILFTEPILDITLSGLEDGTTYDVSLKTKYNGSYSPMSNIVPVTVDASAPLGSQVLTLSLVQ